MPLRIILTAIMPINATNIAMPTDVASAPPAVIASVTVVGTAALAAETANKEETINSNFFILETPNNLKEIPRFLFASVRGVYNTGLGLTINE